MARTPTFALLITCLTASCAHDPARSANPSAQAEAKPKKAPLLAPPFGERSPRTPENAVTPKPPSTSPLTAIVGATLLLGTGARVDRGTVVFENGRIKAVGPENQTPVPQGAKKIDGRGKFVTPGLIDTHSHMGVYAEPNVNATRDGNEMTDPTTPYVFSEHAFWPQDPAIEWAVAGGVTTVQILPGSGNVIGGRAVTLKLKPKLEARAMRFEGAPNGLKMACGENPKNVYGNTNRQPMSRMGNVFKLRQMFVKAQEYRHGMRSFKAQWEVWKKKYDEAQKGVEGAPDPGPEPKPIDRDLGLETLADVLDGKIKVHIHCYRADEMLLMIALGKELGFQISSFHHAVEGYKIAPILAKEGVAASVWSDWWGFKLEAWDAVEENAAIIAAAGGRPIIHSDSPISGQHLNHDAAKALASGRRLGLPLSDDEAIRWVTSNPAQALGIYEQTGSLEAGKMADLVIWDHPPLSVYASAEEVFIDGELVFDKTVPRKAWSDFMVGTEVEEVRP